MTPATGVVSTCQAGREDQREERRAASRPASARAGNLAGLVELLDPGVVLRTDGFAGVPVLLQGAEAVSRSVAEGASPHAEFDPVLINGAVGVLIRLRGRPAALMAFTVTGGRIAAVDGITDPHRLRRLLSRPGGQPAGSPGGG